MRVALLGATGFVGKAIHVGKAILDEALRRGHTVLAIARHPEQVEAREHLIVKACDVYDTEALAALIHGCDAVISAFNPGWKNPSLYNDQVKGTSSIIAAIKKAEVKRVLWVGGCWRARSKTRGARCRSSWTSGMGQAGFTGNDQCAGTAGEGARARVVLSRAFCGDQAGPTNRKVPARDRSSFGGCKRPEQHLGRGWHTLGSGATMQEFLYEVDFDPKKPEK